jgi:hypothetical protein
MSGLKKLVLAFGLVLALNATASAQLTIGIGGGNPYGYGNGYGTSYGNPYGYGNGYGTGYGNNVIGGTGYGYTRGYSAPGYGVGQGYGYGGQSVLQQQTTIYPGGTTYYNSGYRGYAPTVITPAPVYSTVTPYTTYYQTPGYGYRPGFNPLRGRRRW